MVGGSNATMWRSKRIFYFDGGMRDSDHRTKGDYYRARYCTATTWNGLGNKCFIDVLYNHYLIFQYNAYELEWNAVGINCCWIVSLRKTFRNIKRGMFVVIFSSARISCIEVWHHQFIFGIDFESKTLCKGSWDDNIGTGWTRYIMSFPIRALWLYLFFLPFIKNKN